MTVFSFVDVRSIKSRRFDALVRPHTLALYQFGYRLLQNRPDAEDLVQDVLVKLFPRTNEMAKVRDLRPWLLRVTYHQFIDTLRRRQRTITAIPGHEPVELPDPGPGPEQQYSASQSNDRIRMALAQLNQNQRLLVSMHLVDGYTLEEVAEVLDVPIGTLKSRLHRTRAELKKLLGLEPFPSFERVEGHELL